MPDGVWGVAVELLQDLTQGFGVSCATNAAAKFFTGAIFAADTGFGAAELFGESFKASAACCAISGNQGVFDRGGATINH